MCIVGFVYVDLPEPRAHYVNDLATLPVPPSNSVASLINISYDQVINIETVINIYNKQRETEPTTTHTERRDATVAPHHGTRRSLIYTLSQGKR